MVQGEGALRFETYLSKAPFRNLHYWLYGLNLQDSIAFFDESKNATLA